MKMSIQEKVADLERRILALEGQRSTTTRTTTTTTGPMTPEQQTHFARMWTHFDQVFVQLGKVFK